MRPPGAKTRARDLERPATLLSRAKLDGLLLRVPCDRRALAAELARMGRLRLAGDDAAAFHPLHLEFWHVHDGAVLFGGIDLRALSRSARALGRTAARALGTYSEVMVSIPGVRLEGGESGEPHAAVLGMLTDSPVARWADRTFGYGYGKEPARFEAATRHDWNVRSAAGDDWLRVDRQAEPAEPATHAIPDLSAVDAALQQPLLGRRPDGTLVQSRLRRSLAQADAHVRPVGVSLLCHGALAALVPERREIRPYAGDGLWGALAFANLDAGVSYPRALRARRRISSS